MGPLELLHWQWQGYTGYHRNRTNLLLHIFAVPLFLLGTVLTLLGVVALSWALIVGGLACILVSVVIQGRGHKLEPTPPAPFTSPWNFIGRLFFEQWITFPRFVLGGGWRRNLSDAR